MLPVGYVQNDKLEIPEYIKNMSDEELKKAITELEKEIKEPRSLTVLNINDLQALLWKTPLNIQLKYKKCKHYKLRIDYDDSDEDLPMAKGR